MLTISLSANKLRITFARSVEAAGNNEPLSRAPGLQARRGAQDFRRWLRKVYSPNECLWYGNVCLFFAGRKSETELPALAAQPRAFSSLLSLPSQAQSVIKAFRRQGIGSADVFNTARFILSRLESLFASQKVFQIFRGRAEARLCDLFRSASAALHKSHRLAKARIKAVAFVFLSVGLCLSRKDPYLPLEPQCVRLLPRTNVLAPYGICRQFPHPLRGRENRRQTP